MTLPKVYHLPTFVKDQGRFVRYRTRIHLASLRFEIGCDH